MKEHEDLLAKVEKAREQIAELRRQQTELEREKAALEDLKGKQDEWYNGKKEAGDALLKSIAVLESEDADMQKMVTLMRSTRESFSQLLEQLTAIKEDRWTPATLKEDLNKALLILQKSRREISVARGRIPSLEAKTPQGSAEEEAQGDGRQGGRESAVELMRRGFWLALPAAVMAIIVLVIRARQ